MVCFSKLVIWLTLFYPDSPVLMFYYTQVITFLFLKIIYWETKGMKKTFFLETLSAFLGSTQVAISASASPPPPPATSSSLPPIVSAFYSVYAKGHSNVLIVSLSLQTADVSQQK